MSPSKILAASLLALLSTQAAGQIGTRPPVEGPHDDIVSTPPKDVTAEGTAHNFAEQAAKAARRAEDAKHGTVPAVPADIVAGRGVSDARGVLVGTVMAADAEGAVVRTAAGAVKIPLNAFGKNGVGLVIGITKAKFDALVAKANALPG